MRQSIVHKTLRITLRIKRHALKRKTSFDRRHSGFHHRMTKSFPTRDGQNATNLNDSLIVRDGKGAQISLDLSRIILKLDMNRFKVDAVGLLVGSVLLHYKDSSTR